MKRFIYSEFRQQSNPTWTVQIYLFFLFNFVLFSDFQM